MKLKVKKSRLWISGVGVALALGFLNNCAVIPFLEGAETISWMYLIISLAVMLGLGGARDVVLRQFRYLGPVLKERERSESKGFWTMKVWIPCIGWFISLGFFSNCCIYPFFKVGEVSWEGLLATLSVLLTVSGAREYGIYAQDRKVLNSKGEKIAEQEPMEISD